MGKHHKHHKSSGYKKHNKMVTDTSHTTHIHNNRKVDPKKKHHKKKGPLNKVNKIGKGALKRTDSVGKFAGGIVKKQSNAIANVTNAFSNPIVLLGIGAVALVILLKK